jgi:hypothetical protein
LRGNDFLLKACQHLLPVGHGQTQVGDIVKIIRPDLSAHRNGPTFAHWN